MLLMDDLIREGFDPYLTSVGGSGLGILSPYPEHRTRGSHTRHTLEGLGQVTPPDTPIPQEISSNIELTPLHAPFVSINSEQLAEWAAGLGRWLYV